MKLDPTVLGLISAENLKLVNQINGELNEALQFEIRNRFKNTLEESTKTAAEYSSSSKNDEENSKFLLDKVNILIGTKFCQSKNTYFVHIKSNKNVNQLIMLEIIIFLHKL